MVNIIGNIGKVVQKGLEARDVASEKIVGKAQEVRNRISEVAHDTREEISGRGPGLIGTCKYITGRAANIPMTSCKHLLQAGADVLTFHPVKAAGSAMRVGTSALRNTASTLLDTAVLGASATRGAVDTTKGVASATGKVVTAPLRGVRAIAKLPLAASKLPLAALSAIPAGAKKFEGLCNRFTQWNQAGVSAGEKSNEAGNTAMSDVAPGESAPKKSKAEMLTGIPAEAPVANDNMEEGQEESIEESAPEAMPEDVNPAEVEAENDNAQAKAA